MEQSGLIWASWTNSCILRRADRTERRLSDRNVFSEHLLWSVCIYLSDRLYVLYGNVRGADFFAQGFYCSDPAAVPVRHFLWCHSNIAGMDLGALWDLSDFANILMVYCNLPLQYLGLKYVTRAWKHFEKQDGTPFTSEIAGIDVPVWEEKAGKA